MSKRTSMLPASAQGPKPPTKLSSSLTISDTAVLTGRHPIVLSSESVVHPRCRLESLTGPLVVGKRCVIHERTHVGAPPASGVEGVVVEGGVELKDYVTIEAAAVVEAGGTVVEEGSVVGVGVRVGAGARIGKVRAPRCIGVGVGADRCRTVP
ncbi:hypothetical protein IMZ48_03265 [Candidatus Bathyarchaeota archaeon]|nr:hypothetical protein [Candidatus Bathyarchaeota archaeon]